MLTSSYQADNINKEIELTRRTTWKFGVDKYNNWNPKLTEGPQW